jgi:hypothetical protein
VKFEKYPLTETQGTCAKRFVHDSETLAPRRWGNRKGEKQKVMDIIKKFKPVLVTAAVAIIAVGVYVNFIKPKLPSQVSNFLP